MNEVLKSFGIEWKLLLWQAVNFGILFALLRRFFYAPVRRILRERQSKIVESINKADALEKKSRKLEQEFKQKMTSERKEIEEIHTRILLEQEKMKKEMRKQAEQEAARMLDETRKAAKHEREEILKSLEDDVRALVVSLASQVLEREVDASVEKKLIQNALAALKKES